MIPFWLQIASGGALARVEADGVKHMNKSNARFRGRGQSPQWRKVAEYERALARQFRASYSDVLPVGVFGLIAVVELDLGDMITKGGARRRGKTRAKACDVDGVKAILDAANGIVYRDDSQIDFLIVRKRARPEGIEGDRVTLSIFAPKESEEVDAGKRHA